MSHPASRVELDAAGARACSAADFVWITVPTALYPDSSKWRIALAGVDAGTRISQQFHVLRAPKVLAVLYALDPQSP